MKNRIGHRILVFAVAICAMWSFTGCRKSDSFSILAGVEGNLRIEISQKGFAEATRSQGVEEERQIRSMAFLLFRQNGKLHSAHFYPNVSAGVIGVDTNPGKNLKLVGVANYAGVEGLENRLRSIGDYDGLSKIPIPNTTIDEVRSEGLVQYGEVAVPILNNKEQQYVSLKLNYIHSKVFLNIRLSRNIVVNSFFKITEIAFESIPVSSPLKPVATPAPTGYERFTTDWSFSDMGMNLDVMVFLAENLSGGRVKRPAPDNGLIETGLNAHMFKRHYAPDKAAHAKITATYGVNGVTKELALFVYLGRNEHSDYNIASGEMHSYVVKINGMSNVDIDTNVEVIN